MNEKSLKFNLKLTVPETEFSIENIDMDFVIKKSFTAESNTAEITIWNLDTTSFQQLIEQNNIVEFYAGYGEDTPTLIFRGYIKPNKINKGQPQNKVDYAFKLRLVDGLKAYNTNINKNYRGKVSSTQIIKDCISAMGLGISLQPETYPVVYFNGFKAIGRAHVVLEKICNILNLKFCVQNDLIQIVLPQNINNASDTILLDKSNCIKLYQKGKSELIIVTPFLPNLTPNDFIECDFNEFKGFAQIKEICHYGNNFGTACTTEITIGINNNDE